MFKNILVAIDGSGHSKKALEFACDLANKYAACLTVLHVAYNAAQSHTMVLGASAMSCQGNQKELDQMAVIVIDASPRPTGFPVWSCNRSFMIPFVG